MKKIKFIGEWAGHRLIRDIIAKKYEVEMSDNPDYIIVSPLCSPLEYMKYDCVRILFTGEPYSVDFNIFDYAIGFDYMSCLDSFGMNRYYRFPLCFIEGQSSIKRYLYGMSYDEAKAALKEKKHFCNFMFSHQSANGIREELFEKLSTYKRVDSAGSFKNNMPNGRVIPYNYDKMKFLSDCKFTIAAESINFAGFCTEKIMDPFCNTSIPIYYGNPFVLDEFNEKAFVNCHSFGNLDEVVDYIKYIDNNDELYIDMLMQPKLKNNDYYDELNKGFIKFIYYIFDQSPKDALRRMNNYAPQNYQETLKELLLYEEIKKTKLYQVLKKTVWRN